MSYAMTSSLQSAVYNALVGDTMLFALMTGDIYDAPPMDVGPNYITIGEEVAKDRSSATHSGTTLDFDVTLHSSVDGFHIAKSAAAMVCDLLVGADLSLARGALVNLRFLKSRARRGVAPETRRIVLVFRAILDDGNL